MKTTRRFEEIKKHVNTSRPGRVLICLERRNARWLIKQLEEREFELIRERLSFEAKSLNAGYVRGLEAARRKLEEWRESARKRAGLGDSSQAESEAAEHAIRLVDALIENAT